MPQHAGPTPPAELPVVAGCPVQRATPGPQQQPCVRALPTVLLER